MNRRDYVGVMKKDLFIYIETQVQFDSIAPLVSYLGRESGLTFDIFIPSGDGADNQAIYDGVAKTIIGKGITVVRKLDKRVLCTEYKIALLPYTYKWLYHRINAKYRIEFQYGSHPFNKASWGISRYIEEDYHADAVLLYTPTIQPILEVFFRTHIVPDLKFINFKKAKKIHKKRTLFFAPTYNEMNFAVKFLENIDEIKRKYRVIMRGHHRTDCVNDGKELMDKLYSNADEVFESEKCSIKQPLEQSDIMVSDDSGAIFDAIYCGVPVALFSKDTNAFRYHEIDTIQHKLVKRGDVLWTNKSNMLFGNIEKTLLPKMLEKQRVLRDELFPEKFTDPIERWMQILNIYLNDELPGEYVLAKKYWIEHIDGLEQFGREMQARTLELEATNRELKLELDSHASIKRSVKLVLGNIKLRIMRGNKRR
jgi:hypothetical protein